MEANWCKREDTEDKETTEIITKALNASMDIHPGCKVAPALAEPPGPVPCGDWLLQVLIVPVPLSVSLCSSLAPSLGTGRAALTCALLCQGRSALNDSP